MSTGHQGDHANPFFSAVTDGNAWTAGQRAVALTAQLAEWSTVGDLTSKAAGRHFSNISATHGQRMRATFDALTALVAQVTRPGVAPHALLRDAQDYAIDRMQRAVLLADCLRERGDNFFAHEAAGCPPVLIYDHEIAVDGRKLPRPCNYMLLKILPPQGIEVFDWKRPYMIIDPRAGHGAGIGGFKVDSQVGVALKGGHPVYFTAFWRNPEPGQTLADVARAEAAFVRHVQTEHPDAPKPVVIGNCQGGWATLILGASNPDITGPLVLNGAPVETWSGDVGSNPMRYNAGLLGGQVQPMFWSDYGDGVFDGAWLVLNFEMLNPGRTWFRKYYDVFEKVDTERGRFLDFEKWWSGFFLLNEPEIVWIVRELFVGNKLARNEARLEHGRVLDVKQIRSPIIVFASHGDNITPVKQALNWIMDTYADETEIKIRGQRIVYMVHESIGHLGIFVSSSIAKREHQEMASTLKTIEALAPGLYEMVIEDVEEAADSQVKHFTVSFAERRIADLPGFGDGRQDEVPFGAVERLSELQGELYDIVLRPLVQASVTKASAELGRQLHPLRLQRAMLSSRNPLLAALPSSAEATAHSRKPAAEDNPFVLAEKLVADAIEQSFDIVRDLRDAWYEVMFFSIYATPQMRWFGRNFNFERTRKSKEELVALPEVQSALLHVSSGGFVEAVIRMLILLADARGTVRRDRLERSARVLTRDEPFRSLKSAQRAQIIHEQSLIVEYAGAAAIDTLPDLLRTPEERRRACEVVQFVPGALADMEPRTLAMLQRFRQVLDLPPATLDVLDDPLAPLTVAAQ
jgi:pimeloyl-ACP methyl ester carboxylesterase